MHTFPLYHGRSCICGRDTKTEIPAGDVEAPELSTPVVPKHSAPQTGDYKTKLKFHSFLKIFSKILRAFFLNIKMCISLYINTFSPSSFLCF
jgi:hypothetical protein